MFTVLKEFVIGFDRQLGFLTISLLSLLFFVALEIYKIRFSDYRKLLLEQYTIIGLIVISFILYFVTDEKIKEANEKFIEWFLKNSNNESFNSILIIFNSISIKAFFVLKVIYVIIYYFLTLTILLSFVDLLFDREKYIKESVKDSIESDEKYEKKELRKKYVHSRKKNKRL